MLSLLTSPINIFAGTEESKIAYPRALYPALTPRRPFQQSNQQNKRCVDSKTVETLTERSAQRTVLEMHRTIGTERA